MAALELIMEANCSINEGINKIQDDQFLIHSKLEFKKFQYLTMINFGMIQMSQMI